MKASLFIVVAGCFLTVTSFAERVAAQSQEAAIVESATNVLSEFVSMPNEGIPRSMLARAQGLVIVPRMVKVGLAVGVRHGKGIAVIRDDNGVWRPPTFISMTGGSVGFQVGIQSTDVVLVFNTRRSVTGLLSGKLTVGVDVAAAAGPVGREAAAATDARLQAEIFSYSRGRGLFAGASVDSSVLQVDAAANQQYYTAAGLRPDGTATAPNAQYPPSTTRLLATLAAYAPALEQPAAPAATGVPGIPAAGSLADSAAPAVTGAPPSAVPDTLTATRLELVQAAHDLGNLLDETWRNYLALPRGVFSGQTNPTVESLDQALKRYDAVKADSRYRELLDRQEFQQLYGLLQTYFEQVRQVAQSASPTPSANSGFPVDNR